MKLTTISEKVHEKYNNGMSRMKVYREIKLTPYYVQGSFKEQYLRLYDYTHELLRSIPNNTIKLKVQPTESQNEETEQHENHVRKPLLPSFQQLYTCLDACKRSLQVCRLIIGVYGCFLKGYYGGQILAAIDRDPNEKTMVIVLVVVEAEPKDLWAWFLDLLVQDLGGPQV